MRATVSVVGALWRCRWVALGVVVGNAAVQALLVAPDPVAEVSWGFAAVAVASVSALLIGLAVLTCAALAAVDGRVAQIWPRPAVLGWVAALGVLAVAASLVHPLLAPVPPLVMALVLPASADGRPNPLAAGIRAIGAVLPRYLLAVLGVALLTALSWAVALGLGFFVAGPVGAFLTWLWFGAVVAFTQCLWAALYRRAVPTPP